MELIKSLGNIFKKPKPEIVDFGRKK